MVKQRGMTLLEMLVAMMIMSAVMALASSTYSYFIGGFKSKEKAVSAALVRFKAATLWQKQLSRAFYYMVKRPSGVYTPFFEGTDKGVYWMASTGVKHSDAPVLAWLGIKDQKFTYCEKSFEDTFLLREAFNKRRFCNDFSLPLADVKRLSIEYFGYKSAQDKFYTTSESAVGSGVVPKPQWFNNFDGAEHQVIPEYVKIVLVATDTEDRELEQPYWVHIQDDDSQKQSYFLGSSNG